MSRDDPAYWYRGDRDHNRYACGVMMRDRETVDQELRLLAVVREVVRHYGGTPTSAAADRLLDERLTTEAQLERDPSPATLRPTTDC